MKKTDHKRLLALDGGGLMGIISLGILAEVEAQLRAHYGGDPEFRLRDFFDFIGGTSTGAIIAAGLMMGRSVKEIQNFYDNDGAAMFEKASLLKIILAGGAYRYNELNLRKLLKIEFTGKSILELQKSHDLPVDKHLLIVMRNASTDSCWPLCTNPKAKYNGVNRSNNNLNVPLWQLIRASTAAPSYFKPEFVMLGDKEFSFVDGGLTPHNNPALKMYQIATTPQYNMNWNDGVDNMMILSIGTGSTDNPVANPSKRGTWLGKLAISTPEVLMGGISVENDVACRSIGLCTYGAEIDRELGTMSVENPKQAARRAFTYTRYDADVSPQGLLDHGVNYSGKKLTMDKVEQMPVFKEIGNASANQVDVKEHFGAFLS